MDWKLVGTTFAAVFLAELGDKTQLMTLTLAGSNSAKRSVFIGAAAALVSTSAIAVLAGDAAARVIPIVWMRRFAGLLFVGLGLFFLWDTRNGSS
jgi:putative Ca2+/H+ antiporter (TMEM165/GDT1 family)